MQSKTVQKFGIQNGRQRYKCMDYGYIFRRPRRIGISKTKNIIKSYIDRKQTLAEIASDSGLSKRTIHRRIESYGELKRITHDMTRTDKTTFIWWLEEFKRRYIKDFEIRELDTKTLRYRYIYPRLLLAYKSLLRDIDRLFVSILFIEIIRKNIKTK